jgi:hypothetical protein
METVLQYQYRQGKPGQKDGKEAVVVMGLAGSKAPSSMQGGERLPGIANYPIGNKPSSNVDYGVYAGVDLVYRGAGIPILPTNAGPAHLTKPAAGQEISRKRVLMTANYKLPPDGQVGFRLGQYARKRQLAIDPIAASVPPIYYYSNCLGSGDGDSFNAIAVDPTGQASIRPRGGEACV